MRRYLTLLILLCAGHAATASAPASLPPQRFVAWAHDWGSKAVEASGLTLKIEPHMCGDDRPLSEACGSGDRYVAIRLQTPNGRSATFTSAAGHVHYIGVGKLGASAHRPSVMLISDSGGSGGCVTIDMAVPDGAGYRTARLRRPGQSSDTFCAVEMTGLAWPHDLTRHKGPELLLADDRFACAFSSCAGTWYPPRVIAIEGTKTSDVSADPRLARLFRADMARARAACIQRIEEPAGACAGFAADAARLGQSTQAWPVIQAQVNRGCREESAGECPAGASIPKEFPTNLRAFLSRAGYLSGG